MGVANSILTPKQLRCIHALARAAGLDNDELHAIVETTTGKESIKTLTSWDAKLVIDRLKCLTGQETTSVYNRATREQVALIHALAAKLGWADDPTRLTAWLEKRYHVSHPHFLDDKGTNDCIIAMKAMLAGGRGERKGGGREQLGR